MELAFAAAAADVWCTFATREDLALLPVDRMAERALLVDAPRAEPALLVAAPRVDKISPATAPIAPIAAPAPLAREPIIPLGGAVGSSS